MLIVLALVPRGPIPYGLGGAGDPLWQSLLHLPFAILCVCVCVCVWKVAL